MAHWLLVAPHSCIPILKLLNLGTGPCVSRAVYLYVDHSYTLLALKDKRKGGPISVLCPLSSVPRASKDPGTKVRKLGKTPESRSTHHDPNPLPSLSQGSPTATLPFLAGAGGGPLLRARRVRRPSHLLP